MAGKYFYKNSDITNFFVTGNSTVTGFSGISYYPGSSVLMEKPYNFNMTTPSGDISQLMYANYSPLTSGSSTITVPSNHNAFSAFIMGGGGGGGGGGGCGYSLWDGRHSGGDGSPGGDGNMTISYPYVPILPGSTITYQVGGQGNNGGGGNDAPKTNGGSGNYGGPGNTGGASYIRFTPATATPSPTSAIQPTAMTANGPTSSSSTVTLYANGGAGGSGGDHGTTTTTGSNSDSYSNGATSNPVGPSDYYSPSPTYSTGSYSSLISPSTNVTTNIGNSAPAGNTINNPQFGYLSNFSDNGGGGYKSANGNPATAAPGGPGKPGYIHIYYYKI